MLTQIVQKLPYLLIFVGAVTSVYLFITTNRIAKRENTFGPVCQILLQIGSAFAAASFALSVLLIQVALDRSSKSKDDLEKTILKLSIEYQGNLENLTDFRSRMDLVALGKHCKVDGPFNRMGRINVETDRLLPLNKEEAELVVKSFLNMSISSFESKMFEIFSESPDLYQNLNQKALYYYKQDQDRVADYLKNEARRRDDFNSFLRSLDERFVSDRLISIAAIEEHANGETLINICNNHVAANRTLLRVLTDQANITTVECLYLSALSNENENLMRILRRGVVFDAEIKWQNMVDGENKFSSNITFFSKADEKTDLRDFTTLQKTEFRNEKCSEIFASNKRMFEEDLPARGTININAFSGRLRLKSLDQIRANSVIENANPTDRR